MYIKKGTMVYGKRITPNEKVKLDQLINDWLRVEVAVDDQENKLLLVETLYSLRLLDEIINYGEGNFDHISSLRLLCAWNSAEAKSTVVIMDEEDAYKDELSNIASTFRVSPNLKFLEY